MYLGSLVVEYILDNKSPLLGEVRPLQDRLDSQVGSCLTWVHHAIESL